MVEKILNWILDNPETTIALLAFIISIVAIKYTRKTQRNSLLHNLSMSRIEIWAKKNEESSEIHFERLVNFYEYISFLTLKNEINKKYSKELFKDDINNLFEKGGQQIRKNGSWKDIITLYEKWKKD